MKSLVIGLGSMGKRRVRCLQSLGVTEIMGVDLRTDRCEEAVQRYGIRTQTSLSDVWGHFVPIWPLFLCLRKRTWEP